MNYFIQFLIVFDLICFGVYFGGDIICTALAKVRKKPGQKDPYEFEVEDEPAEPPLSIDAIRHLFRGEVRDFVCNKLLPSGQETLSALTEPEQTAARFLFCALIGYLKEEAPMDEQSFPMVMEIRYEGLEWIKSIGQTVQRDNYDLVYTAPLTPGDLKGSVLDNLEYRFNNEHPADYRHPSMSVSDIVGPARHLYHHPGQRGPQQGSAPAPPLCPPPTETGAAPR